MSDMKCPFCQQELVREGSDNYWCKKCNLERCSPALYGSQKLWQELIRTRKALDATLDKLKRIRKIYTNAPFNAPINYANVCTDMYDVATEQITALEQKKTSSVNNKIKFPEYNDNLLEEFDKQFFENGQDDDLTETALEQKEQKCQRQNK